MNKNTSEVIAEIIAVGDELLIGQTIDTNSAWLGERLGREGIRVKFKSVVGDNRIDMINAIELARSRSDIVLVTGGLGPTQDDITKEVLCEVFQTSLGPVPEIIDQVTAFFTQRGLPMLDSNLKQGWLPKVCTPVMNPRGTAPGMWFDLKPGVLVSMPGVPYEMKGMIEDTILDKLKSAFDLPTVIHKTVLTTGVGESYLAETISDWEFRLKSSGLALAYLPSPGMVKLRISSYSMDRNEANQLISQKLTELNQLIGDHIFGFNNDTLSAVVGALLIGKSQTLATSESCTGGFLAHLITEIPGSSNYYNGGVVTYTNELKHLLLGISCEKMNTHGVVNEGVALEMAESIKQKTGSTWALSTTGIAGPTGELPDNPVGSVWIGLAGPSGARAKHFQFGKNRGRNIILAANSALDMLRKEIK